MTDHEQPRTPSTVRLTNLDTGETVPLDGVGPITIHLDNDPQDQDGTPPLRTGGILPAGAVRIGQHSHGCGLPPRPAGQPGPQLVHAFPAGPVFTEEQRAQICESMHRVHAELRRVAAAILPAVRAAGEELGRAVDTMVAAGLDRTGPDGHPRRSGRDAQVSPYGPRQTRR